LDACESCEHFIEDSPEDVASCCCCNHGNFYEERRN
jgi:hypothetical protein